MKLTSILKTKSFFTGIATLFLVACTATPNSPDKTKINPENINSIKMTSNEANLPIRKQDELVEKNSTTDLKRSAISIPYEKIQRTSSSPSHRPAIPKVKASKVHINPISLALPE